MGKGGVGLSLSKLCKDRHLAKMANPLYRGFYVIVSAEVISVRVLCGKDTVNWYSCPLDQQSISAFSIC
jgi:hypothetical protein